MYFESTEDTALLENFIQKKVWREQPGGITVTDASDGITLKRFSWDLANITSFSEEVTPAGNSPMLTEVIVTPLNLNINNLIFMDRRWPQTSEFWRKVDKPGAMIAASGYDEIEETQKAECAVYFRRPDDYDSSYGFDWLRTGDTGEKGDEWYKTLMASTMEYDTLYVIPWVTLMKGHTAKFRVKLEVNKSFGELTFKFNGSGADVLSSALTSLNADRTGNYYHGTEMAVNCSGTFSSTTYLEVFAGNQLVGKMAFLPNDKVYPVNISFIAPKITDGNDGTVSTYFRETEMIKNDTVKYLTQSYIKPNIVMDSILLDLTEKVKISKLEKVPLFDKIFRDRGKVNTARKVGKNAPHGVSNMNIFDFLDHQLYEQFKEYPDAVNRLKNSYRIYLIDCDANVVGQVCGISSRNGCAAIFKSGLKAGKHCTVHELYHLLGLYHPFPEKGGFFKYLFRKYGTDNIMDYPTPGPVGDKRKSLWYWQMKQVWRTLKP